MSQRVAGTRPRTQDRLCPVLQGWKRGCAFPSPSPFQKGLALHPYPTALPPAGL